MLSQLTSLRGATHAKVFYRPSKACQFMPLVVGHHDHGISFSDDTCHLDFVQQPMGLDGSKVFTSKAGNTYLDFCEDYRACPFSSVIFSQDRTKFGDLSVLQGQFVEIRGLVSYYKDRPQIIIRAPEQLKLREELGLIQ